MTPFLLQPEESLSSRSNRKSQHGNADSSFSITVSLNADRRRVFHVLTIAEYMETWLQIPGRHRESSIQVTSDPSGFHVRYFDDAGNPASLVGAYQIYRTAKTNFLWRRTTDPETDSTLVKIRLNGDFERTTLHLSHLGFDSREKLKWHAQLWEQSLDKLSSLFELQ